MVSTGVYSDLNKESFAAGLSTENLRTLIDDP